MCVISATPYPQIAKNNIKCYKILKYTDCGGFKTPAVDFDIPHIPYVQEPALPLSFTPVEKRTVNICGTVVAWYFTEPMEWVHAYVDYGHTRALAETRLHMCIAECIIPKDTIYYPGIDGDLASRKLILQKIL